MPFLNLHVVCAAVASISIFFSSCVLAEDHVELEIWPGDLPADSVKMNPKVIAK